MNKILGKLLLFEKHTFSTKLTKQQIQRRVEEFTDFEHKRYYGRVSKRGFFIGERFVRYSDFVRIRNSFAPVATARISENDDVTTVSLIIRMHLLVLILFTPIYVTSLLTIVLFPPVFLLLHIAFFKPAMRLNQEIENLLLCNEIN